MEVDKLARAVEQVRSKEVSLRQAGKSFGVSVFYLNQRVKGIVPVEGFIDRRGLTTVLSIEVDLQLADFLKILAKWGHGLSRQETHNTVGAYCQLNNIQTPFTDNVPGQAWWTLFSKRTKLKLKNVENLQGN